jgi:hypothetical protein
VEVDVHPVDAMQLDLELFAALAPERELQVAEMVFSPLPHLLRNRPHVNRPPPPPYLAKASAEAAEDSPAKSRNVAEPSCHSSFLLNLCFRSTSSTPMVCANLNEKKISKARRARWHLLRLRP